MSYGQLGAVVGNVIGSYFGPVGGAIGSAIGGYIGSSFDPAIVNTGPRLSDTKMQNGAFGTPIGISFGSARMAGTVIFETKIREHYHRQDAGKGGQKAYNDTYTYDFDFAVVLTDQHGRQVKGIKGIRRIWANGGLIYSASETASLTTLIASGAFCDQITPYLGTDTQMPDPTIEAACGVGNVSAYRGYSYVVFRGVKVLGQGQPTPQMEFEVVQDGTEAVAKQVFATYAPVAPEVIRSGIPWAGKDSLVVMNIEQGGAIATGFVTHVHTFTPGVEDPLTNVVTLAGIGATSFEPTMVNCSTNPYACMINYVTGNTSDGMMLEIYDIGRTGGLPVWRVPIGVLSYPDYTLVGGANRVAYEELGNDYAFGHNGGPSFYYGRNMVSSVTGVCPIPAGRYMIDLAIYLGQLYVWNYGPHATIPGVLQTYISVYGSNATLLYEWLHTVEGFGNGGQNWAKLCINEHGAFTWCASGPTRVARCTANGPEVLCVDADIPGGAGDSSVRAAFWTNGEIANVGVTGGISNAGQTASAYTIQFKALTKLTIPVGDAVKIICNIAGLDDSEIGVSQLTQPLRGYAFKTVGPASGFIEPLATCFFFEGYESEGQVKFCNLGGPVLRSIPYDDLAFTSDGSLTEAFPLVRTQEKDLPRSLALTYANPAADYQTGAEPPARRLITSSVNDVQMQAPIVFTSDEAAKRQSILLYKAWTERDTRKLYLSRKHIAIEPTDVLSIEYPRGTWTRWRVRHIDNQGQTIALDVVADEPDDLVSTAVGGNPATETTSLTLPSPTLLEFIDSPIFNDTYNDPGMFVAMGGRNVDWHGALLRRSINGTTFSDVDTVSLSATMGTARTTLGNYSGVMPNDEHSVLRVFINTYGTPLQSYTEADLLADETKNAAICGDEIIQFRTATLVSPNLYDISGIKRGQRGTEWAISQHATGERFVLLTRAGILRVNFGAADIGQSHNYVAISVGATYQTAKTFTNTAVGLKPFAPVDLGFGQRADGSGIFRFTRRTRLQVNQVTAGSLPLGEASEKYTVEIAGDPTFATITRTILGTSTSIDYTAAQIVADRALIPGGTIYWRVYQMSDIVGKGFVSATRASTTVLPSGVGAADPGAGAQAAIDVPVLAGFDGTRFIAWFPTTNASELAVLFSTDGLTWSKTGMAAYGSPTPLCDVVFAHGLYISTQPAGPWTYTSTDAITWTGVQDPSGWQSGTPLWDGTQWVKLGQGAGTHTYVYTSLDGVNWTVGAQVCATLQFLLRFAAGAYFTIQRDATTNISSILRSTDLVTWTTVNTQPTDKYRLNDMAFNAGVWAVMGTQPNGSFDTKVLVLRSTDGITFTDSSPISTLPAPPASLVVSNGEFFAAGTSGGYLRSSNAAIWSQWTFTNGETLYKPVAGLGKVISVFRMGASITTFPFAGVGVTADGVHWLRTGTGALTTGAGAGVAAAFKFNGSNGSTTFVEETGRAVTREGAPIISTAQFTEGPSSGYFPGSSRLAVPASPDFNVSTSDWQVSFDARFDSVGGAALSNICGFGNGTPRAIIAADYVYDSVHNPIPFMPNGVNPMPCVVNYWYSYVVRKDSTGISMYKNGSLMMSAYPGQTGTDLDRMTIGDAEYAAPSTAGFVGYIDNFKYIRGVIGAPPTKTPVVAFELMHYGANGSAGFGDSSTVGATVTAFGNAQIQSNALALDGTGDYLTVASDDAFNVKLEDFDIELKFKTTATGNMTLASRTVSGFASGSISMQLNAGFPAVAIAGLSAPLVVSSLYGTTTDYKDGNEHALKISRRGTRFTLFINGSQADAADSALNFALLSSVPFVIGTDAVTAGRDFNGTMRQIKLTRYT